WTTHETRQQMASVGSHRGGSPCRRERSGAAAVLRTPSAAEGPEFCEGGNRTPPAAACSPRAQPRTFIPKTHWSDSSTTTSDRPHEAPTGGRIAAPRVPKKG